MSQQAVINITFVCDCPRSVRFSCEPPLPQRLGFAGGVKSGRVLRTFEVLQCACGHRYAVEVELPVVEVRP